QGRVGCGAPVHTLVDTQLRPGAEASRADAELAAARTRSIQARRTLTVAQVAFGQLLGITGGVVTVDSGRVLDGAHDMAPPRASVGEHPLAQVGRAAVD